MRVVSVTVVLGVLLSIGSALRAADPPPPEYKTAMQTLGGVMKRLNEPGAFLNFGAAKEAADEAKAAFAVVEAFWSARGDEKAVALAAEGVKAADDLATVADLYNPESVATAVEHLTSTCMPCHAAYREKAGSGFLIK